MSERHRQEPLEEKSGLNRFLNHLIEGFAAVAPLYGTYVETPPASDDRTDENKQK